MALTQLLKAGLLGLHVQGDCGPLTIYHSSTGKHVYYDRAPPLTPATPAQKIMRDRFRAAGMAWQMLTADRRKNWQLLAERNSCKVTGYNLYTWWYWRREAGPINTLEQQAGVTVLT